MTWFSSWIIPLGWLIIPWCWLYHRSLTCYIFPVNLLNKLIWEADFFQCIIKNLYCWKLPAVFVLLKENRLVTSFEFGCLATQSPFLYAFLFLEASASSCEWMANAAAAIAIGNPVFIESWSWFVWLGICLLSQFMLSTNANYWELLHVLLSVNLCFLNGLTVTLRHQNHTPK